MPKTSKRLGRGLASLITDLRHPQGPVSAHQDVADATVLPDDEHQALRHIEVDQIRSNPFQPRQNIPDAGIISLAESIRSSGMIQPISVRSVADHFEIIAGERRWRAAKVAGWARVPVIVREVSDQDMLEMALIENIQREDLNAIDRAQAYRQYCDRFGLSAEEVAGRLGEDRTTVTNYMRLLELESDITELVASGRLSMGHARCICGVPDRPTRLRLAKAAVAHDLSVRALEAIARRERHGAEGQGPASPRASNRPPHVRDLEEQLSVVTGTKVVVKEGRRKGAGRIVLEYYSLDDFERLAGLLGWRPRE